MVSRWRLCLLFGCGCVCLSGGGCVLFVRRRLCLFVRRRPYLSGGGRVCLSGCCVCFQAAAVSVCQAAAVFVVGRKPCLSGGGCVCEAELWCAVVCGSVQSVAPGTCGESIHIQVARLPRGHTESHLVLVSICLQTALLLLAAKPAAASRPCSTPRHRRPAR
jgi:hypothetical protein